jgi:hypothetical protein
MRLRLKTMRRLERDEALDLAMGYEADALGGVGIPDQVFRLQRWRRQGWSPSVYYMNIFAMFIGYARAKHHV